METHSPEYLNHRQLTFAEFSLWKPLSQRVGTLFPIYNNFYTMFLDVKANHIARNKPLYKRFQAEQPELDQELTQAITLPYKSAGAYPDIKKILQQAEPLLYKAYCIMHEWVTDDEQLFI